MGNENICVIPGTFDPVTNGHIDIIDRSAKLFGAIYVVSLENSMKKTMFSSNERKKMLELACGEICGSDKITVEATNGLLADYAASKGAGFIVKGVRNAIDYEYEYMQSIINREIGNGIDTLLFPAKPEHSHLSSSFVREMIAYGREISGFVPEKAHLRIREILRDVNPYA
ncbi:MAG: pantetheine-phosphate adenylyltransferase [Oscillospiraceae bacterium]|nr:pantetheine-phosphate adenylyltransferase [Oscillospiraceae bacterium]